MVFLKKPHFCQNRHLASKIWRFFCRMRLKCFYFLKLSFHFIFEVSRAKTQKNFEVGNYGEETEY